MNIMMRDILAGLLLQAMDITTIIIKAMNIHTDQRADILILNTPPAADQLTQVNHTPPLQLHLRQKLN